MEANETTAVLVADDATHPERIIKTRVIKIGALDVAVEDTKEEFIDDSDHQEKFAELQTVCEENGLRIGGEIPYYPCFSSMEIIKERNYVFSNIEEGKIPVYKEGVYPRYLDYAKESVPLSKNFKKWFWRIFLVLFTAFMFYETVNVAQIDPPLIQDTRPADSKAALDPSVGTPDVNVLWRIFAASIAEFVIGYGIFSFFALGSYCEYVNNKKESSIVDFYLPRLWPKHSDACYKDEEKKELAKGWEYAPIAIELSEEAAKALEICKEKGLNVSVAAPMHGMMASLGRKRIKQIKMTVTPSIILEHKGVVALLAS